MKICPASFSAREKDWGTADKQEQWMINNGLSGRLLSFYAIFFNQAESRNSFTFYKKRMKNMQNNKKIDLFLDSGAYSAFTKNVKIDINEYITFIKENEDVIDVYSNLDVISSAEGTWRNQIKMEKVGLHPLPVYHYGEDISWLQKYLDRGYDYMSLGGMVPISTADLRPWLDNLFSKYLTDEKGIPFIKIHGFGLTSLSLLFRYPWYSVDSTSWVMTSRMGGIQMPRWKGGEWCYDENSWKISVSNKSPSQKDAGAHFTTMTVKEKELVLKYIEEKGYCMGSSTFRIEKEGYVLQDDERWAEKKTKGPREVEKIEVVGLCNDYKLRDELNIIYYLDLEKSIPEWPWAFKIKRGGFGL
jgi:hypothetical protein